MPAQSTPYRGQATGSANDLKEKATDQFEKIADNPHIFVALQHANRAGAELLLQRRAPNDVQVVNLDGVDGQRRTGRL